MFSKLGPYWKGLVATLLPVGQLGFSLYSDGVLTTGELKQLGAEVLVVLAVWLKSAPGYSAPGEIAVPVTDPIPVQGGFLIKEKDQRGTGFKVGGAGKIVKADGTEIEYGAHEDRDNDGVADSAELAANDPPPQPRTRRKIKDNPQG